MVGELAASVHCVSHSIAVMELCYARNPENLERLANALNPFYPTPRGKSQTSAFVLERKSLESNRDLTLATRIGEVNLLEEVEGVGGYETVKANAIEVGTKNLRFLVLDIPSLIASKKFASRKKTNPSFSNLKPSTNCSNRSAINLS